MRRKTNPGLALALSCLCAGTAGATEGGGSIYPHGAENFMSGALPPPGIYGMVFATHYNADQVRGNAGQDLGVPGFEVTANVVAPRLVWVPGTKLFGGDMVLHTILPLVSLEVEAGGQRQRKRGLGDMTVGIGTGHHYSDKLHSVTALDLFLPTGRYRQGDLANIGRNHWGIEPVFALSYVDPTGPNADFRAAYTFNRRNGDTGRRDGQELHFDYALGWGVGHGWTLGVGGYVYRQTTDDRLDGATVPDNKGRALSIGPSVKYDSGRGWFVTAKFETETRVRNRAEGKAFWLKAVFPL